MNYVVGDPTTINALANFTINTITDCIPTYTISTFNAISMQSVILNFISFNSSVPSITISDSATDLDACIYLIILNGTIDYVNY